MSLDVVAYLTQHLVSDPSALEVSARQEGRTTYIEIRCATEDAGRIIGRHGRIINSIRTLARAASSGHDRIEVNLIDSGGNDYQVSEEEDEDIE
ncbi:MAG: KH domain-containing protein [Deinococcales bacterium]